MPCRVLLVDDNSDFRTVTRQLLERHGFVVVAEAEAGVSGIEQAKEHRPDLVLVDVQLPDIDGFEVAERLSRLDLSVGVVLTSSLDGADYGALVARSPALGFVPKAELSASAIEALLLHVGSPGDKRSDPTRIRVVLADDSVLLREGIASLLEKAGFEIVGQSGTAEDLLLKVRSYKPDIAIVDIKMPPTQTDEGLRAAKEIREKHPDTAVLVLSQYVEEGYALELLQESAEGVGYLLKDRVYDLADFVAAVKRVAEGGSALDPSVVSQLVGRRRRDDPIGTLTAREREVLELMAEGLSNSAIAARVFLTDRGVEKHVTSIFQKLQLPVAADTHRRVLAVVAFLQS
jgi:DNA-binding NarL/FixJ family response regulator